MFFFFLLFVDIESQKFKSYTFLIIIVKSTEMRTSYNTYSGSCIKRHFQTWYYYIETNEYVFSKNLLRKLF